MLQHYKREASDPDWLVRVGEFHGHLGPWVVIGAMAGHDAIQRLGTSGYWDIEVVCWMPREHQRQPWSCILDGLQVSTGATLGKQNIRMAWSPEIVRENRPVIHFVLRGAEHQKGYSYRVGDRLVKSLSGMSPERLEAISREIAGHQPGELFEIQEIEGIAPATAQQ